MAELIFDEMIRENFKSRGNGVFELLGPNGDMFEFETARRANGVDGPQVGDQFPVTLVAAPGIRCSCIGVYTPGSPETIDCTGGPFFKTSALAGGLPDFGTKEGVVGLTLPAPLLFLQTLAGGIANPAAMRSALLPITMQAFKAAEALIANEAVLAQSGNNTGTWTQDFLGGMIAAVSGESDAADEQDIFATATGGIKGVRRSIKRFLTRRAKSIDAGQYLALFNAAAPGAIYHVFVINEADKTSYAQATIRGDASAPEEQDFVEKTGLKFDKVGTSIRIQNTTGATISVAYAVGREV